MYKPKDIQIVTKKFEALSLHELYDVLQLRSAIFVVEQDCIYQDIDGKDAEALHVLGIKNDKIVAYSRCFGPEIYFEEAAIGRMLVKKEERKQCYAHLVLNEAIEAIEKEYTTKTIKLSAQQYLIDFYEKHGFQCVGEGYLEDGIPHVAMIRKGTPGLL